MPHVQAPTLKQKQFVKAYFETGSKSKAAQMAYKANPKWSAKYGHTLFEAVGVKTLLQKEFEARGLTEGQLSKDIARLKKKTLPKGRINDPRLHFDILKEEAKMAGWYAAEKKTVETKNANLNIDLKGKTEDEMSVVLQGLKKQLSDFERVVAEAKKANSNREIENGTIL